MLGMKTQLDDRRREDRAGREVRPAGHLDGLPHRTTTRRSSGAGRCCTARCSSSSAKCAGSTSTTSSSTAAGHRRRGAEPEPDRARRRRDRRHHAAAGVARRQPPRGGDVQEAEHPDARHHREHELLRVPELPATRPTSSATAAARRWRPSWACRSSGAFRSTSRFARAATPACRSSSASPTRRPARAFIGRGRAGGGAGVDCQLQPADHSADGGQMTRTDLDRARALPGAGCGWRRRARRRRATDRRRRPGPAMSRADHRSVPEDPARRSPTIQRRRRPARTPATIATRGDGARRARR